MKAPYPPPEDPTKKALAELEATTAQEIEAARQADRRAESLAKARLNAIAESESWRRREMLVRQQVSALTDRAREIDRQIDTLASERDVLARERDALKAAVTSSQQGKGSYAVLPYKGANGSWRRPIVLECSNGTVTLRPNGPTFSMLDLSSMMNPRSSPVILAIARELLRVQMSESPDGAPVVPYFVFLIRPDGIRAYYEVRARLEPLGIAFGYELIDQDLKVDVPDFDNLATWDGTIPLVEPLMPAPASRSNGASDGLAWPSAGAGSKEHLNTTENELASRPGNKPGVGDPGSEGRSPDEFVWPSQRGRSNFERSGPLAGFGNQPAGQRWAGTRIWRRHWAGTRIWRRHWAGTRIWRRHWAGTRIWRWHWAGRADLVAALVWHKDLVAALAWHKELVAALAWDKELVAALAWHKDLEAALAWHKDLVTVLAWARISPWIVL